MRLQISYVLVKFKYLLNSCPSFRLSPFPLLIHIRILQVQTDLNGINFDLNKKTLPNQIEKQNQTKSNLLY